MKIHTLENLPTTPVSHNAAIQKKVMLHSGELPNLIYFSQAQFAPGQVAGAHAHEDMSEVFFVESGEGTIQIDGQVYPLRPGTVVAVEPQEVHEVANTGTTPLILTYFGIAVPKGSDNSLTP